jgi:reverse gyrase
MMVSANMFSAFFGYTFKEFGETNNLNHNQIDDQTLSIAASVGSGVVNGLTRVVFGALTDKYSFKQLYAVLMTV